VTVEVTSDTDNCYPDWTSYHSAWPSCTEQQWNQAHAPHLCLPTGPCQWDKAVACPSSSNFVRVTWDEFMGWYVSFWGTHYAGGMAWPPDCTVGENGLNTSCSSTINITVS